MVIDETAEKEKAQEVKDENVAVFKSAGDLVNYMDKEGLFDFLRKDNTGKSD